MKHDYYVHQQDKVLSIALQNGRRQHSFHSLGTKTNKTKHSQNDSSNDSL